MRTIMVLRGGEWIQTKLETVKKGEMFKMFESDGTPVEDRYGNVEWEASSDAYKMPRSGIWGVDVK